MGILSDLMAPAFICIFALIPFIIFKCLLRGDMKLGKKTVNFGTAGMGVFLIIIGKIMDTLFKMIRCAQVGDDWVHYYFAYEKCRDTPWIVSIVILCIVVVAFGTVFVLSRRLSDEQRANPNSFIFQLTCRFKPAFWYWEFVIFIRRTLIAFFAVALSGVISKMIFLGVMIGFIWVQYKVDPFVVPEANQMEFVLLCCIPFVIMGQMPGALTDAYDFVVYTMSILIVLPAPLLVFYVIRLMYRARKEWKEGGDEQKENLLGDDLDGRTEDAVTVAAGTPSPPTPDIERGDDADYGAAVNGQKLVSEGDGAGTLEVEMGTLNIGNGAKGNTMQNSTTMVEDDDMIEIQAITDDLVSALDGIEVDDKTDTEIIHDDEIIHDNEFSY